MKLISMTDFVLEQNTTSTHDTSQIDWYDKEISKLEKIRAYANFLKQHLNLGMFVTCDLKGNVMKEPNKDNYKSDYSYGFFISKYKQAKERVLFEGFEVRDKWLIHNKYTCTSIDSFDTIEDIVNFGLELTLTKSAQKQLGL